MASDASVGLRILLVEDDEDDYIIVRDLLAESGERGWKLDWTPRFEEALQSLRSSGHDLYLVDYLLGAHDGLELLDAARKAGCRAPVIFLTGQGGYQVDVRAMQAGAADYLVKEVLDVGLLERSIRYALQRARTVESLQRGVERFRGIAEAVPVPVLITSLTDSPSFTDSTILYVNESLASLLGLSHEQMVGRNVSEFYARFDDGEVLLQEIRQKGGLKNREVSGTTLEGRQFWLSITTRTVDFDGVPAAITGMLDVTELKAVQRRMIHFERLRAVGEISAGVSHNLNNLLVAILGPAQAMQGRLAEPRLEELAGDIVAAARRARDLIQRLQQSVRRAPESTQPVQLNDEVRSAVRDARPRWKDAAEAAGISIEVVMELEEDLPPVSATATGVHEILLNLLLNAVDAMPEGGRIAITSASAGDTVELTVSDTGTGMDEETRRRIFEPFFTTKMEVGTGLGLATAHNTVDRFGGSIDVESEPGRGTRFLLKLPVWTSEGSEPPAGDPARMSRRARILLIDDDPMVRKALCYILEAEHEVVSVASGQEALDGFEPGRYDAVLIDLGMPQVPGYRVREEIHYRDARVATVLVTGWEIDEKDPRSRGFDFVLQKPFYDQSTVRDVVARAVDLRDSREPVRVPA